MLKSKEALNTTILLKTNKLKSLHLKIQEIRIYKVNNNNKIKYLT